MVFVVNWSSMKFSFSLEQLWLGGKDNCEQLCLTLARMMAIFLPAAVKVVS